MRFSQWRQRRKWMREVEILMWLYTEAVYGDVPLNADFYRHAIIGEFAAAPSEWVRYAYKRYPSLRELVVNGSVADERRPA